VSSDECQVTRDFPSTRDPRPFVILAQRGKAKIV
jgi:hypothetical protein